MLATGLLAAVASVVVTGDAAAQVRAGDPAKWRELDQFSGKGKVSLPDGTTLDSTACVPNEGPKKIRIPTGPVWNARGPDFSEDMRELCRMVKSRKTPEQLVEHVQNDALIDFAFKATAGMDA